MKMRSFWAIAIVLGWTAYAAAEAVVYDFSANMLANEKIATPSATFNQWTLGYKTVAATVSGCTALDKHFGEASYGGFSHDFDASGYNNVYAAMNTGSTSMGNGWDPGIMSGGISVLSTSQVFRWKAPTAGTVNIAATIQKYLLDYNGDQDVHIVLGNATDGTTGTSLFTDYLRDADHGDKTSVSYSSASPIAVTSGSVIDLVIGTGSSGSFGQDCFTIQNYQISFTAVPEPSSIALVGSALVGLLAYAWRKRK